MLRFPRRDAASVALPQFIHLLTKTSGLVFFLHVTKQSGTAAEKAVRSSSCCRRRRRRRSSASSFSTSRKEARLFVPRDRGRASGLVMPPSPTQARLAASAGSEVRLLEEEKLQHLGKSFRPRGDGELGVTRVGCRRAKWTAGLVCPKATRDRRSYLRPRYSLWELIVINCNVIVITNSSVS